MTSQGGGGGTPSGVAGGVLGGSYPSPAFATNGTTPLLGVVSQILASPVTMTNASQAYDGPLIALTVGMWLIGASLSLAQGSGGSGFMSVRLWDGTTTLISAKQSVLASSNASFALSYPLTVAGPTTIRAAAESGQAAGLILATTAVGGEGTTASSIWAMRIA